MPYWLSLLADLLASNGQPTRRARPSTPPSPRAQAHDDVWWLPEVMRMRAAHDERGRRASPGCARPRRLAAAHGSVALLRRCEHDLAERGVRPSLAGRSPRALTASAPPRTLRERRPFLASVCIRTTDAHTGGDTS